MKIIVTSYSVMKTLLTTYLITFYLQLQSLFDFNLDFLVKFINQGSFFVNTKEISTLFIQLENSFAAFAVQTTMGLLLLYISRRTVPARYLILGTFIISTYLWLITFISVTASSYSTNYLFDIINLLIFAMPFLFIGMLIDTFHYVRTDEEMIETGFGRIPNTAKIIRESFFVFSTFLFLIFFINQHFLKTDYFYIYLIAFLGLIFITKALYDLIYALNSDDEIKNKIRQKKGYFAEAFDKREYAYASLGLTDRPKPGIDKSKIFNAAQNFELAQLKTLLESEPKRVNEQNSYGWTSLMILVANTSISPNRKAGFRKDSFFFLEWLLSIGADINISNALNRNALVYAISYNDLEMVKFLLDNGATVQKDMVDFALEKRYVEIYNLLKQY